MSPSAKKKSTRKTRASRTRRILLFGGGAVPGLHEFTKVAPVLRKHLDANPRLRVDVVHDDLDAFLPERLAPYNAIVVYYTGGELSLPQKRGLVESVAAGKGFVAVHGAACSFGNSPEYLAMLGGVFKTHPFIREYTVSISDHDHPVTRNLKGHSVKDWEKWPVFEYKVLDEQYLLDCDSRVRVLATTLFRGETWPVAWIKPWGKGKVFYLALGHDARACRNPFFAHIFKAAVAWAADPAPDPKPPDERFAIA